MKLLELHINGFGKIHDRTISFSDGINVIYGRNEAGKSTLHTFIRGMLFGMERGRGALPEMICILSTSHGRTAGPTRAGCVWSRGAWSTALRGDSARTTGI